MTIFEIEGRNGKLKKKKRIIYYIWNYMSEILYVEYNIFKEFR